MPVSFAIDAYRIIKRVAGKTSVTFEFRADQAGTFPFYCNLTTDPGCKDMRGVLRFDRNKQEVASRTGMTTEFRSYFVIRTRYFLGNLSGLSVNTASTSSL